MFKIKNNQGKILTFYKGLFLMEWRINLANL